MVNPATGRSVKATGREADLYQAAQRYRNGLIRREEAAVAALRQSYGAAVQQLSRELDALDERLAMREEQGKPLADAALAMRDRLESLINQTQRELDALSPEAVRIVTDGQQTALQWVNSETGQLLYASTGDARRAAEVMGTFTALPTDAIEALVGFSSDGSPLAVLFDTIAQDVPGAMRLTLSSGIAQGRNPRAVARDLMTLTNLPATRAETIARTEMLRAAREGQRRIYETNPAVISYRRTATQDARVCLACLALSGTIHRTAEIMPSHPNCRCVMVPVTPSLAEITGDPSIPDLRPGPVTPDRIMAGLDRDELMGIFGPRRMALFDDGYPLSDMIAVDNDTRWGPTTRIRPLKELLG